MKKVFRFISAVTLLMVFALFYGCKKTDIPVLTTTAISSITTSSASSGGNITDDGGAEVTARGVCWGTATKPEITGSKTSDSKGTGSFTSSITGLTPDTKYYVRAYATNSEGTAYGNEQSFTTNDVVGATLTTTALSAVTSTTAVSGGNITNDGGAAITARGVCWGPTANPVVTGSHTTDGAGTGTFTSNITGLTPGGTYHVRAYATNSFGTAYGNDLLLNANAVVPTVTTNPTFGAITQTTATSGGNVTADGGAAVNARGVCWVTGTGDPVVTDSHTTDGTGTGTFSSSMTQLSANTIYRVRAYATNSAGTGYGAVVVLTTSPILLATVTTAVPSAITASGAVSGGDVSASGGGSISARGVCYGTSPNPDIAGSHTTDGSGTGPFTSTLSGFADGTVYYVRAYATNSVGTSYGSEVQLLTKVADAENNVYNTVLIGTQVWMAENLKVTQLNGGTPISNVTADGSWMTQTGPAYCWYNNTEASSNGALYNWYAASTANLCPTGWHVPTTTEFGALEVSLGTSPADLGIYGWRGTTEGSEMKSTTGWNNNGNGSNTSGFTALPAGYRFYSDGKFYGAGSIAYFWTRSEVDAARGWYRHLLDTHNDVYNGGVEKQAGKSVRCVKD